MPKPSRETLTTTAAASATFDQGMSVRVAWSRDDAWDDEHTYTCRWTTATTVSEGSTRAPRRPARFTTETPFPLREDVFLRAARKGA